MSPKQIIIMIACILFNLLAGNIILYLMGENSSYTNNSILKMWPNGYMSISCIICYYLLFTLVPLHKFNTFALSLTSIVVWYAIIFWGSLVFVQIIAPQTKDNLFYNIILNFFVGLGMSLIGTLIFSLVAIPMGLVNIIWLALFKKAH